MKRTIAILQHARQAKEQRRYAIHDYADVWREDGHDVVFVVGPDKLVPADLAIVHVDLSVVPDEYLELARRYPLVLNGSVKDVRKTVYSTLRLAPDDAWDGRIIVKSNLNFAGVPELLSGLGPRTRAGVKFWSPQDYRLYDRKDDVPPADWTDPELVVERFAPEMDGELYAVRLMLFVGPRVTCAKMVGPHPIVSGKTHVRMERVEVDPEMDALRVKMGLDVGKLDYVVHDGKPILLDANKTVGGRNVPPTPERLKNRRYRAEGLYAYFDRLPG